MLTLESILYLPVSNLPACSRESGEQAAQIIGQLMGQELAKATAQLEPSQVAANLAVSTISGLPFATGWLQWRDIVQAAAQYTRHPPQNFSASYECAGWGFALEYALRRAKPGQYVVLQVVDINLLDVSFWRASPQWGKSGFGISTVVWKVPENGDYALQVDASKSSYHMGEFCVALRKWMAASSLPFANVPFLPEDMIGIYANFLDGKRLMPDLHAGYGHCFGSDTWISYLTFLQSGLLQPGGDYIALPPPYAVFGRLPMCI